MEIGLLASPEKQEGDMVGSGQEELLLNLELSLRVHTRPHFFNWTQGLLQTLIRHEFLLCMLPEGKPNALRIEGFSMKASESAGLCALFISEGFGQQLIKSWEARRFRPMVRELAQGGTTGEAGCLLELERFGATHLFAHGMHDARGGMAGFFVFAGTRAITAPHQIRNGELVIPFIHSAWVRVQMNASVRPVEEIGSKPAGGVLTKREQEILRWIYLGKSNFEIGTILGISPLTVKNHVQKILRKLNVVNRAQAVGKALERRIIDV